MNFIRGRKQNFWSRGKRKGFTLSQVCFPLQIMEWNWPEKKLTGLFMVLTVIQDPLQLYELKDHQYDAMKVQLFFNILSDLNIAFKSAKISLICSSIVHSYSLCANRKKRKLSILHFFLRTIFRQVQKLNKMEFKWNTIWKRIKF